jgi:anti-anti-sigma factor
MNLTVNDLGGVAVFRYAGRMTFPHADRLRTAVQNECRVRVAVLDLAQVSAVDAAGLGTLVSLWNWSKRSGRRLKLMNVPPQIEELLALTNLSTLFEICAAREMLELLCRAFHEVEGSESVTKIKDVDDTPPAPSAIRVVTEALL